MLFALGIKQFVSFRIIFVYSNRIGDIYRRIMMLILFSDVKKDIKTMNLLDEFRTTVLKSVGL